MLLVGEALFTLENRNTVKTFISFIFILKEMMEHLLRANKPVYDSYFFAVMGIKDAKTLVLSDRADSSTFLSALLSGEIIRATVEKSQIDTNIHIHVQ